MSERRPVVWSEGLLLSPQHLQQAERAWRHHVARRFQLAAPYDWGLVRLGLDREAVRNGRVAVTTAAGVLPDGTPFSLPDEDPLPSSRAIEEHFDAKQDSVTVSLGLASHNGSRAMFGESIVPGAAGARYGRDALEVMDETIGQNPRPVEVQRRHFQLLFPDDAVAEHDAIPIGQLERSGGNYSWREAHIPPALSLAASTRLMGLVKALHERLAERFATSAAQRSVRGDIASFAAQDSASAMEFYTVCARLPALSHAIQCPEIHPHELYRELLELAGQLCAFSSKYDPRELPSYDHLRLGGTFADLDRIIRELLTEGPQDRAIPVPLVSKGGGRWEGRIVDDRVLTPGWGVFLSVRADIEESRYVTYLPPAIKVASLDKIDELITFGLSGLKLQHQNLPPAGFPAKANFHQYRLDPRGELWESVLKTKDVAVFIPGDVPNVALELWAVQE